jgi:hypothetical protein
MREECNRVILLMVVLYLVAIREAGTPRMVMVVLCVAMREAGTRVLRLALVLLRASQRIECVLSLGVVCWGL